MCASILRVLLGCGVVIYLFCVDCLLIDAAVIKQLRQRELRAEFVGAWWTCVVLSLTIKQGLLLVCKPVPRVVSSFKTLKELVDTAEHVRALPRLPADDPRLVEDCCAVCFGEMNAASARLTPCGHAFHGKCLMLWLRHHSRCPMCRSFVYRCP